MLISIHYTFLVQILQLFVAELVVGMNKKSCQTQIFKIYFKQELKQNTILQVANVPHFLCYFRSTFPKILNS